MSASTLRSPGVCVMGLWLAVALAGCGAAGAPSPDTGAGDAATTSDAGLDTGAGDNGAGDNGAGDEGVADLGAMGDGDVLTDAGFDADVTSDMGMLADSETPEPPVAVAHASVETRTRLGG